MSSCASHTGTSTAIVVRIVREHEALELRVAVVVAAHGRQNERRGVSRGILLFNDDELIEREKIRSELRAPAAILSLKNMVRARLGN
jgi:hypothetical protein